MKTYLSHDGLNSRDDDLFFKVLKPTVRPHVTTSRINQKRCNVQLCHLPLPQLNQLVSSANQVRRTLTKFSALSAQRQDTLLGVIRSTLHKSKGGFPSCRGTRNSEEISPTQAIISFTLSQRETYAPLKVKLPPPHDIATQTPPLHVGVAESVQSAEADNVFTTAAVVMMVLPVKGIVKDIAVGSSTGVVDTHVVSAVSVHVDASERRLGHGIGNTIVMRVLPGVDVQSTLELRLIFEMYLLSAETLEARTRMQIVLPRTRWAK